jgi:hypothetical protein
MHVASQATKQNYYTYLWRYKLEYHPMQTVPMLASNQLMTIVLPLLLDTTVFQDS